MPFVKGQSGNPHGARISKMKHSSRTIAGAVERFVKRNFTPHRMQKLYDELDSRDKLELMTELLPYVMPKQSQLTMKGQLNSLTPEQLDELYLRITSNAVGMDTLFTETLELPA